MSAGGHRPQGVNHPPSDYFAASCENLHQFGASHRNMFEVNDFSNIGNMGVVTLAAPDENGDRAFVSRRALTQDELAAAWMEHHARGLAS